MRLHQAWYRDEQSFTIHSRSSVEAGSRREFDARSHEEHRAPQAIGPLSPTAPTCKPHSGRNACRAVTSFAQWCISPWTDRRRMVCRDIDGMEVPWENVTSHICICGAKASDHVGMRGGPTGVWVTVLGPVSPPEYLRWRGRSHMECAISVLFPHLCTTSPLVAAFRRIISHRSHHVFGEGREVRRQRRLPSGPGECYRGASKHVRGRDSECHP